jgi:iron complex outermembrane receptor protein
MLALVVGLSASGKVAAQQASTPAPAPATQLPEIAVRQPKQKPTVAKRKPAAPVAAQAASPAAQAASTAAANGNGPPLQQVPALGKTGTKLEDLPASVQIIPH